LSASAKNGTGSIEVVGRPPLLRSFYPLKKSLEARVSVVNIRTRYQGLPKSRGGQEAAHRSHPAWLAAAFTSCKRRALSGSGT